MSFSIKGTLIWGSEIEQVSDSFKKRDFAIKVNDGSQYENIANFQLVQDKTELLTGLRKGDEIEVHFDLRGREWNGKYFTNLTAWKITKLDGAEPAPKAEPVKKPEPVEAEASDDLPF